MSFTHHTSSADHTPFTDRMPFKLASESNVFHNVAMAKFDTVQANLNQETILFRHIQTGSVRETI